MYHKKLSFHIFLIYKVKSFLYFLENEQKSLNIN